jgi:hypothetical protein
MCKSGPEYNIQYMNMNTNTYETKEEKGRYEGGESTENGRANESSQNETKPKHYQSHGHYDVSSLFFYYSVLTKAFGQWLQKHEVKERRSMSGQGSTGCPQWR